MLSSLERFDKIQRSGGLNFSGYQGFKVSGFQGVRVLRSEDLKV